MAAFERQTDRNFEVIIAIDGSDDDTEMVLAGMSQTFPLRWINTHCKGYGLAVARNLGILTACGQAVVILDDDSFPQPSFVAAHRKAVAPGVITGGPRIPSDPSAMRMVWKALELGKLPSLEPMTIPNLRHNYPNAYLIENNICLLRDDWLSMGLFCERLKLYGFIGQEFFGRAEYLGIFYQYAPQAIVTHHGELEGDNGLTRRKKKRQIALAGLFRPSLMQPHQYQAQIRWAKAKSEGRNSYGFPMFFPDLLISLPIRLASRVYRSLISRK